MAKAKTETKAKIESKEPRSIIEIADVYGMTTIPRMGRRRSISWGSLRLDYATNGIPLGQVTQISGDAGCGKTLLGISALSEAIKENGTEEPLGMPVVIDVERRWDEKFVMMSGVGSYPYHPTINEDGKYILIPGRTIEKNWNLISAICDNNLKIGKDPNNPEYVGFILMDSLGNAPDNVQVDADSEDNSQPGYQARKNNNAARVAMQALDDADIPLVMINTIYQKIGIVYGSPYVRKGGGGVEYVTSVGLSMKKMKPDKSDDVYRTRSAVLSGTTFKGVNGKASYIDFEINAIVQPKFLIDIWKEIAELGIEFGVFRNKNGEKISTGASIVHYGGKELVRGGAGYSTLIQYLRNERELAEEARGIILSCILSGKDYEELQ